MRIAVLYDIVPNKCCIQLFSLFYDFFFKSTFMLLFKSNIFSQILQFEIFLMTFRTLEQTLFVYICAAKDTLSLWYMSILRRILRCSNDKRFI